MEPPRGKPENFISPKTLLKVADREAECNSLEEEGKE
jgi:hypothetical protein